MLADPAPWPLAGVPGVATAVAVAEAVAPAVRVADVDAGHFEDLAHRQALGSAPGLVLVLAEFGDLLTDFRAVHRTAAFLTSDDSDGGHAFLQCRWVDSCAKS